MPAFAYEKKSLKARFFQVGRGKFLLLFTVSLVFSDWAGNNPAHAARRIPAEAVLTAQAQSAPVPGLPAPAASSAADWQPLLARLAEDGFYGRDIEGWFAGLKNPYSPKPMGWKINALFHARFIHPAFSFLRKPQKAPTLLHDTVTEENVRKSAEFILDNPELFALIERAYKVEKEIVVAVFMVETRLGNYLGSELVFWSLACMAVAAEPGRIETFLDKLPMTEERLLWVKTTLRARSEWAYKELKAFIEYCRQNRHNPLDIAGSPFGAFGLCQFMPGNISVYAADGDQDGRIDLFSVWDALPSIASFLVKHGWQNSLNRKQRHRVIRRYNHSDVYADTVLALAERVRLYLRKAAAEAGAG
jgi:membrane-bound lytic murein transglycosylase B